jgi:tetratricopeptide (TPR) repeat protein
MARAIRDGYVTPADELRSQLAESEKLLANLGGNRSNAADLLHNMDRIDALWPELEAAGADLRGEAGRWETLQSGVRAAAPRIVRQIHRSGSLSALRAEAHPDGQAAWWWHLDREMASRAGRRLRRIVLIVVILVALVFAAGLILNRLFPVDPRVREATGKIMAAQTLIQNEQDYAAALTLFEGAAALTPGDSEAWLWLGATQQKLGRPQESAESFAEAARLIPAAVDYRAQRATIYLALGMLDESLAEVDAALALDPENPQAYIIQAGVFDIRGQVMEAIQALQQAADFADKRNLSSLSASARYQMGMLMQRMPIAPAPSPTPVSP